jgi:processive 1,2-diacylglycerol beta-glucosyltransferase
MRRVLILTASYGSGHNSAARSLALAFARDGASVDVIDHFRELVHPGFARASRALYYMVLRRAPVLWGMAYGVGDWMASDSAATFGATHLGASKLAALLRRTSPDAVVTVHATPAAAMSFLAEHGEVVPPHTTVVTDFVAHGQWIARHVDRYCVAAEEVRHEFIARGIPGERVIVTGVPVPPAFETWVDPGSARAALGLSSHVPVVLAMAGTQGSFGRLPEVAQALVDAPRPLQAIVVTGTDVRLAQTVGRLTAGTRVRTLGYTKDVRTLMAAADLLVTKAGGMTLAEALAAELPLLTYGSLPGQERQNERFASRAGIALVARTRRELARLLDGALAEPALLDDLRESMRQRRRPDASRRIARAVLEPDAVFE